MKNQILTVLLCASLGCMTVTAKAADRSAKDEITRDSEAALKLGLEWLARNQGAEGNWGSNDLGLVSMGALAFLSDGNMPGRGRYRENVQKALNYVTKKAKPSGLLNIAGTRRDMYNHGLATFVLAQAHGMSGGRVSGKNNEDLGTVLDRALKLIANTQRSDGGWNYEARPTQQHSDLSLAVMQAKALRSAVDSGLEVPPEIVKLAIENVRKHYMPRGCRYGAPEKEMMKHPGQFTYSRGGGQATPAMAAAGVVCLQEFGQYDDWRIKKNMELLTRLIVEKGKSSNRPRSGYLPFDAYTLNYLGQALYQVGGPDWKRCYPILRDSVVGGQCKEPDNPSRHGHWQAGKHVSGKPGALYGTAVACFILAMPNRYLPILQEGKIEGIRQQFK